MALDDFSKGYYEKRRAMMGRAPVQDSGDVMRKVNKQVYQAERSRPVLEQAAAEMQTEGRERSIGERIGKTVSGAAKSYLSSLTNAGGDAARTQGGLWRDFTRDSVREWQQEIDRWERDLSAWRADGSLTREEEEDLTGMIQANREKIATYTMAQEGRRGSAEAARGLADQIALSGARDTDQAKEGIGAAGQFAVDSGTGLVHLAGDIGLGAMTGGAAAIPLAVRSYGGSSQKARLEGANDDRAALYGLTSAAMEVATGMLGNVGRINSKFFGGGAVDDVVEGMVRALERKGGGKLSRALLNRAGTAAAGFVTEGAEEALSAIIDPFLRRAIYSDGPLDAGEILGDALYDFAVGGAVGGIAGGIGGTDTTRGLRSAERNADAAIDRAYDAMGSAGPWSPAAAEAAREANGLLEQAARAAAETGGISGKAADRILRDESALEQLRQQTGLELSDNMTQSERRAAVKQAASWLAVLQKERGQAGIRAVEGRREPVREERRADGDIGPYGMENRTAGGEKQTAAKRAYDAKRVRDGARAFGESGAKALAAAYDGRTDAESYYGGFAAYYQAGISNMDMRKVRSEYGAQLSEAQKYAAYVAGQNDAILSIQRERQAAPYAKSAGSDSGLVYDDFVRQAVESGRAIEDVNGETRSYLTAETAAKINSVAKSLGVRVQFVDSVRGGTANAQISGSTVLVERNNPNPVMAVVGHEMTHRMQELAPAEYREFRDIIAQEEQSSIQRRVDAYAAQGVALTYEQAMDEVAADYAGRMIDDGKVLDRFIEAHKENRTLLEKVRDAIQAIVRKLTGAEKKQAQTAEGKLTAALEAAAKQAESLETNKNAAQTDGEARFSIKRTSQMTLAQQLKMFYDGKMASSDAFYFGETPAALNIAGLDALPLAFTVSDFRKSSKGKHNVPRRVWKNLHSSLETALFSFRQGDRIGIVTGDIDGDGKPLLVGIERNVSMDRAPVNAIRSVYGLDNPGPWLQNQIKAGKELVLLDREKANAFLQTYGAYSASVGDGIRSMGESVTQNGTEVKTKFSIKSPVEETWIRQAKTLQAGVDGDTMGATRNSLKDLTEGERSALLQYKSSESYKINAKLRDGISLTEAEQKMVDELDHALEKLSRVEGTVYRRLSFDMEGQEALDAFLSEHAENNFVPYEAYTSGSTAIDGYPVSGELTVTQIISGKTGRDMTGIGNNFESEVVFPRGCDFIVERVTQDAQGNPVIYMKEVEENGIGQLHPEERVQAVQQVQETSKNHDDLHKVSEADTARGSGGKRLSGVRGEGNEEVKFSLKSPVEETKNLIALHNLTEEKLWGDLRLGGFPMPSIAVTRTDVPHTNFGDITLVMDKRSIDPKANRKNTVYSADAWTPTFPQVEYAADPAAERRISGRLRELSGKVDEMFKQDLYRITYDMEDLLNRYGGEEELLRQVMDNYGLKAAYLEDAGHHVSAATVQREADKGYSQDRVEKYRAIVEVLGTDDPDEIGHIPLKELRDRYGDELEAAFPGMTKSTFRLSGIIRQVQAYLQDQGSEPVYETVADAAATRRAIDDALDRDGYERWVRELYSGVQADSGIYNNKERFTPAGNRRTFRQTHYPVTLENIVKAMKGQNGGNTKNVSGFYGVKSLRAGTAKRFKSIADMHKLEGRLQNLTEEQTKAIHDELDRRLMDLTEALAEKSPNGKGSFDYYLADSIGNMLVEIADGEVYTIDAIMGKFNGEYGFHIGNELAAQVRDLLFDVSQMPVNIFEAKPERAVGFDEVLAAVLPDDASGELRDALSGRGVNVLTYKAGDDADRIAKVNGVEGARFSLKEDTVSKNYAAILEENELLRDRVEYWKGQTRRTKRVTTDKKAVSRAAQELIRSYGADLDAGDITQDLQSLYDYVASGYDGKDELTYTEVRRRAEAIAEKLVGNAVAVDETYEQYSDLRAYLRSTTLSLSEEDSRDIPDYGDWRKHQMGRMVIRKGHTNIDQVYQEMSEMWPEFFDEQRENNPVDQLLRIAEVMDGIYNVEEYNPFGPYMQQAITGAANEIMEQFFDLPQTRATFADRQARKLDDTKVKGWERVRKVREQNAARLAELRQQNRERTAKAVERERTRRSEQIGKLKQRYREKDAAGRERRSARELRAKIMRHASALSQKLLRPSDKQHIPENLRQAVAAMLESINLESAYTTDPNTGKRVKDGSGTPTKRTEAFRALRLSYAEIAKDGGDYTLIIDPDLMDNLNELESMKNTPIADMGMDQLTTVWATLKAVEASIRTANKMLGASRFETISGFADGIRSDNILRQDRGDYRGIAGKVDRLVNLDMLTPQGYFHRLGKTGEELFRMMRAAQDRHITIMQQAQDKTAEIIGKTDVNKLEREKHTFELSGGKVTMSTAQIMGLYELMKRKQAQDHILKGGIRPDTISSGRGLREDRRSDPVKVSVDDLATITGTLTEEQIRIADGLQKFMGGKLAELGNEASMAVYGYRKFTEKDYYPIKVDKNQTKRDISKEAQAATIAGRGFTKSVTPKANNAVMLESIFDTYSSHVNDMATYAAWLPTMENIHRIRDFTFRDGEGNRTGDVKSIIERVFGKNGNAYLNKLVDDINQGVRPNGTGNFTDALVGNYKAAAVAANIRVILQQPTAILRAMSSLNPKYLLAGTVKRGDWAKVKKYAPIAVWKDWGYFDINTGRQMKDVLLSSDSVMEKAKQAAMAGAGKADSFAWARLWNAVEAETRDKRPGLKPGTEAFYQAVSTRFSEVVDQTQVVDGLLQRSQIMRSTDALTKMATSFMAEPAKTYNMFVNAVYDLRHATGKDGRSNAKRALARTSAALVVSFAVNAVMQSIVDALRDDDKERDYWEKFLTAYTGFTGEEETALDYWNSFWDGNLEANFNPAGYIPYFKDLVSIMQGYDVSRMDMEPVSKVLEAAANMKKALSGEGKYSVAGASANLLAEVSRLLGIPVANLKRDIQAGITTAAIETDNYLMQYRIDKAMLNMGYQGNTKNFYDILYNASINDREAYETIYADMVASGMPEDKIRNAMESRMKRDQGVESVGDLEQRYLSPIQERSYNSTRNSMAGSSVWTAASRDQQEAVEKDLYDLTVGNDSGEKLQEKIAAGAAYGISEADYLLYRLALHVADQPTESGNLGSYTGEEVQTAIDMLTGLDDEARAYLWEAAGKSEKSNPYK